MFTNVELVFFPSASPLRAIIKQQTATTATGSFAGLDSWTTVATEETGFNSSLPFYQERPFIVSSLKPVLKENAWFLQDKEKKIMRIRDEFASTWKLLSLSGGQACTMAVIGKEETYEPLGIWINNEYKIL
jgi:hypothetical protein